MKKVVSLYQRNYESDRLVRDEVVPGAEWVLAGEGVASRKIDGTCCMVRDGALYRRHELRPNKVAPDGFEPATDVDPRTGKQQGWVPVGDGPEDKWYREAWNDNADDFANGTYELVGPKVQGNPENYGRHSLVAHADPALVIEGPARNFVAIRDYLEGRDIEGIVWHHPDGRWAKIKGKDFGFRRQS